MQRKVGPERASLTAAALDYAGVPLLGPAAKCLWDDRPEPGVDPCASFTIATTVTAPTCEPPKTPRPQRTWVFGNTSSKTAILERSGDGAGEWTWITRPSGTDALFVARYTGELGRDDGGLAKSRRKVAAKAIVPHQVYVFRTCESACDAPLADPQRVERVTVIGPPSVWVGSSGEPSDAQLSKSHPFTMISASARAGEATSLTIAYTSLAGSRFQGAENVAGVATNVQTVTLEVVWDSASGPTATVYRGTIPEGAASDVRDASPPLDCE